MEAKELHDVQSEAVAPTHEVPDGDSLPVALSPWTWLVGISGYSLFAWLYDYPLYALVIWYLGPWFGGTVMTLLTIPVDLLCLRFYDWTKTDWLAIEYLKATKEYRGNNILKRGMGFLLRTTPILVQVILLTPKFNAFIITTLLRDQSRSFGGLSRRDWAIFAFSFLTTQIYWIVTVYLGLCGIEWFIG